MTRFLITASIALLCGIGHAVAADAAPARVALVIDDLGDRLEAGLRATRLPGPLNFGVLPDTPHAQRLASAGYAAGGDILLHLPMAAEQPRPLGPDALTADLDQQHFRATLDKALASVPHVVGVNNHMGSLLTRQETQMRWLMQALKAKGIHYFLDSRTTAATVAEKIARETGLPTTRRHVFIDHQRDAAAIHQSLDKLERLARQNGYAVGIAHPYAETLAALEQRLPQLRQKGIQLVTLSNLLTHNREEKPWLLSLSRSPRAAKN